MGSAPDPGRRRAGRMLEGRTGHPRAENVLSDPCNGGVAANGRKPRLTRVLIADDQPLMRWALRHLIEKVPGAKVAGEISDLRLLVENANERAANLVVLELGKTAKTTLAIIKDLSHHQINVLVYTMIRNRANQRCGRAQPVFYRKWRQ